MNFDFINACLLDATQVLLMAWTGVLVASTIVAFREAPATVPVASRKPR